MKRGDEGANDLLISPAIALNSSEPSLLQCYLWFIRLAIADERPLNPPTDIEVEEIPKDEQRPDNKRKKDGNLNKEKKNQLKDILSSL